MQIDAIRYKYLIAQEKKCCLDQNLCRHCRGPTIKGLIVIQKN